MSATPSQSAAAPAVPVVPVDDYAHELLAMFLAALGAHIASAIVAMGSLTLLQATRRVVVDDVQALGVRGLVPMRRVELALRTLALAMEGDYPMVVDAIEARACTGCDDCLAASLEAQSFDLCAGCRAVLHDDRAGNAECDDVSPTASPPQDTVGDEVPCRVCHGADAPARGAPCSACSPRPGLARCGADVVGERLVEVRW